MKDQRRSGKPVLAHYSLSDLVTGEVCVFLLIDLPSDDGTVIEVRKQVQVIEQAFMRPVSGR
jgi:hypothetical protein